MKVLKIISLLFLFAFFGLYLTHSLNSINQDIGRHLRSGQIIWETRQVYKTNLFSFTEPDHPFINHHWLSEVVFYGLNGLVGLKGLILFKVFIILAALSLLFWSVYSQTGLWPLVTSSLVGFVVFTERTDIRPEIFSYLFLSFFIFAILRAKYKNNYKFLMFLPLIQIFWTNMHIYFALGPILMLFFVIDRYFEKREGLRRTSVLFLATCAATLLNPNFLKGALAPFNILKHYGYSIVENQNIFFLRDYGISLTAINLFEISTLLLILSFIIAFKNGRKKMVFEILGGIFFTVMAGKMIRNFGIYALFFIPIVTLNLSVLKLKLGKFWKAASYAALAGFLVFLIFNVVNNNVYGWLERSERFGLLSPSGADKAVKFVRGNSINGPVFNNFDVGSFLIWKLPEQKVFVDGRPEAYSVDFFEKIYKPMQEDPKTWNFYSQKYGINYIFFAYTDITPWAKQFLAQISKNPDWPMVYLDESTVIFLKKNPQNKSLIEKFEMGSNSKPF